MRCKYLLMLCLLAIVAHATGLSQEFNFGHLPITNYDNKIYKAHAQNWAIVQDQRNVMYIGNTDGLLEFDGLNWRKIKKINTAVRSIAINKQGTIFVGTIGDFGYLKTNKHGERVFQSLKYLLDSSLQNIKDVWETHTINNFVYFRTSQLLIRISQNLQIKYWQPHVANGFQRSLVFNQQLYLTEKGVGFLKMQNNQLKPTPIADRYKRKVINSLIAMDNNKVLIATANNGVTVYDTLLNKFYDLPQLNQINKILVDNQLTHAITLSNQNIAYGTSRSGVFITDKTGKIHHHYNKENGLQNEVIRNLYADINGNLWLATNNGISMLQFTAAASLFSNKSGLPGTVNTIIKHNNTLYAGTSFGTFYLQNNQFHAIKGIDDTWSLGTFTKSNGQKVLLAGTINGIYEIMDNCAHQLLFTGVPLDIIQSDVDSSLAIASIYNPEGAIILKHENQLWKKIKLPDNIKQYQCRMACQDTDGTIWFSTVFDGIVSLTPVKKQPIKNWILNKFDTTNGLPHQAIKIYKINHEVFFTTEKGLYKFNKKTNRFEAAKLAETKFMPEICGIKYIHFNPKTKNAVQQLINHQGETFLSVAIFQDNDTYTHKQTIFKPYNQLNIEGPRDLLITKKEVWVGTSDGLLYFNCNKNAPDTINYKTLIRKITINNDSVIYKGGSSWQNFTNTNSFYHKNNHITFEFTTPDYQYTDKTKYNFKLLGQNNNWSGWTTKTLKEYTNLFEGEYTFMVKSKNIYDTETPITTYTFTIKPPIYRSVVAYLLYFVLLSLLVYFIIYLNSQRLKRINQKLEQTIADRTKEIVEKNSQLINQHEEILAQNEEIKTQANHLQELNHELKKLSIVASETKNAIMILSSKGEIQWANKFFEDLYGYSIENYKQKFGSTIQKVARHPHINTIFNTCVLKNKSVAYESAFKTAMGKNIWTQTTLTPVNDGSKITHVVAIDADITDIKQIQEQLEQHQKEILEQKNEIESQNIALQKYQNHLEEMIKTRTLDLQKAKERAERADNLKTRFLENLSHEVRTPLNAIIGFSELLKNHDDLPKSLEEYTHLIHSSGEKLLRIVESLMTLSKIQVGEFELQKSECNLELLLKQLFIEHELSLAFQDKSNIDFTLNTKAISGLTIRSDETVLRIIVGNLIENAIKFTEQGFIKIEARQISNQLCISVKDSGIGIDSERIGEVFKKFIKLAVNHVTLYEGLGLGLTISKYLAQLLDGDITVTSQIHKGSEFRLLIPIK